MALEDGGHPDRTLRRRVGSLLPRSVKSSVRIAQWKAKGRPMPPPHYVKQRALLKAAELYRLRNFVETGTFLGDMLAALRDDFDALTSIELSDELHARAVQRFQDDGKVTLLHGDSGEVITGLVPQLSEPTLFWLDAHYSGAWHDDFAETAGGDRPVPLFAELDAILGAAEDPQHVIYVDDARLFAEGHEGWPTIEEIRARVSERAPSRDVSVAEDIIRILPAR